MVYRIYKTKIYVVAYWNPQVRFPRGEDKLTLLVSSRGWMGVYDVGDSRKSRH